MEEWPRKIYSKSTKVKISSSFPELRISLLSKPCRFYQTLHRLNRTCIFFPYAHPMPCRMPCQIANIEGHNLKQVFYRGKTGNGNNAYTVMNSVSLE